MISVAVKNGYHVFLPGGFLEYSEDDYRKLANAAIEQGCETIIVYALGNAIEIRARMVLAYIDAFQLK